jgi:hypothetical protein
MRPDHPGRHDGASSGSRKPPGVVCAGRAPHGPGTEGGRWRLTTPAPPDTIGPPLARAALFVCSGRPGARRQGRPSGAPSLGRFRDCRWRWLFGMIEAVNHSSRSDWSSVPHLGSEQTPQIILLASTFPPSPVVAMVHYDPYIVQPDIANRVAGGYAVKVRETPYAPPTVKLFETEAEAQAWIREQVDMAHKADRFDARHPRWRG